VAKDKISFDQKFGESFLAGVPTTPGIYLISNEAGELIYVGKAKNLRRRLSQYRSAKRRKKHQKMRLIMADAFEIRIENCASDLDASLLEAKVIQEKRPKWNTAGAFHFIYPMIGLKKNDGSLHFCFTTTPECLEGFEYHGAYRSRSTTGTAFFSLMKILTYIGHKSKTKPKDRIKYSYVYSFRNLPEHWFPLFSDFLKGESKNIFEELVMALVENTGARRKPREIQKHLNLIARFWRHEAKALSNARASSGFTAYPVPQKERDFIFLKYRFAKADKKILNQKIPKKKQLVSLAKA